jgi:hypothetical protein
VARFSSVDYDAMTQFDAMVQKIGEVIRNQMLREPPKLDAGLLDLAAFARQPRVNDLGFFGAAKWTVH